MKQYIVDELRPGDHCSLKAYLDKNLECAGLDGLYWKPVYDHLLTEKQSAHPDCAPFYFILTLTPVSLACELLIRTKNKIRCDCMDYATTTQRNWIVEWADAVFEELGIIT